MVIVSYTRRIVTTNLCRGYGVRKADRNMGANELVNYAFLSRDGAKKLAESLFFFFSFLFSLHGFLFILSFFFIQANCIVQIIRISFLPVFIILGNGVEEGDHSVDLRVIVQIIALE